MRPDWTPTALYSAVPDFTLRGILWVIFDHLHIKQKSASVTSAGPPIGAADTALMITNQAHMSGGYAPGAGRIC